MYNVLGEICLLGFSGKYLNITCNKGRASTIVINNEANDNKDSSMGLALALAAAAASSNEKNSKTIHLREKSKGLNPLFWANTQNTVNQKGKRFVYRSKVLIQFILQSSFLCQE